MLVEPAEIYERYHSAVFHTALGIVRDFHDSEDIMQSVFMQYIHQCEKGTAIENVGAYLMTTTRHLSYNWRRDHREMASVDELPPAAEPVAREDWIEEHLFFEEVLSRLSEEDRTLAVLHLIGGFKHREIAEMLQMPAATVRSRYAAVKKQLKEWLKAMDE